jgi:[CysO sulfur-carrier protein]-S-L-cysteine hydrolase
VRIARELVDQIIAHAREDAPNECCGVLIGSAEQVNELTPTANVFASPLRFEIDATELYRIWKRATDAGRDITGFYHSHIKAPAHPSQTDINWAANWPGVVHVICSLGETEPAVKGFRINDGAVEEIELEMDGD